MSPTRRDFLATSAATAFGLAFGRPLAAFAQQGQADCRIHTPRDRFRSIGGQDGRFGRRRCKCLYRDGVRT